MYLYMFVLYTLLFFLNSFDDVRKRELNTNRFSLFIVFTFTDLEGTTNNTQPKLRMIRTNQNKVLNIEREKGKRGEAN